MSDFVCYYKSHNARVAKFYRVTIIDTTPEGTERTDAERIGYEKVVEFFGLAYMPIVPRVWEMLTMDPERVEEDVCSLVDQNNANMSVRVVWGQGCEQEPIRI